MRTQNSDERLKARVPARLQAPYCVRTDSGTLGDDLNRFVPSQTHLPEPPAQFLEDILCPADLKDCGHLRLPLKVHLVTNYIPTAIIRQQPLCGQL